MQRFSDGMPQAWGSPHGVGRACVTALAALLVFGCGGSEGTPPEAPQGSSGSGTSGPANATTGSVASTGLQGGTGGVTGTGDTTGATGSGPGSMSSGSGFGGGTQGSMQSATSAMGGGTGGPTSSGGSGGTQAISMEACGPVNVDASAVDPTTAGRIVVLGSSTAAGQNASSADKSWVGRYRTYLAGAFPNFTVDNLAMGGFNTYRIQASDYVPPEGRPAPIPGNNITTALEREPDAIIINLPSNDQYEGFSLDEQMDNYNRVAELAAERGVLVWVATSQPRDFAEVEQRQGLMDARDAIQERFAPRAIDFWTDLANSDGTMKSSYNSGDGTHFNDAGHAVLAQLVITCAIPEVAVSTSQ